MFDASGAEVRLEVGTMLKAANYKYDVELVERGEAPGTVEQLASSAVVWFVRCSGTAELVFGCRTGKELRIANATFARGNVHYVDSFTNAEQVKKHVESLPEVLASIRLCCHDWSRR
jgi:hypothetical protein